MPGSSKQLPEPRKRGKEDGKRADNPEQYPKRQRWSYKQSSKYDKCNSARKRPDKQKGKRGVNKQ